MYKIAEYFSLAARQKAVATLYKPPRKGRSRVSVPRRDEVGMYRIPRECCPIGVMLLTDFGQPTLFEKMDLPTAPTGDSVADLLTSIDSFLGWDDVEHDANVFIDAWDNGKIDDLAAALGLT